MNVSCILLSSQNVRIVNENDGSVSEGISLQYIMSDNLKPVSDDGFNSKGYKTSKAWLSPQLARKIENVPAMYDIKFDFNTNSKGKNELRVKDLAYMADINIDIC